jgi:hypothetical protein
VSARSRELSDAHRRSQATEDPRPRGGWGKRGDVIVVTRLRRIGRNHKHMLSLVEWLEANGIDFVVLEQGIDTTIPLSRLFFRPSLTRRSANIAPFCCSRSLAGLRCHHN